MATYTEWSEELREALAEPFPAEWHQTKTQGGSQLTFVPWYRYAERLNELVGADGWETRTRFHEVGGKLIAVAALTILGVTKENVGDEDEEKDKFGTASTNSYAQALKRAAALFGLGLYMYDKGGRDAALQGAPRKATSKRLVGLATLAAKKALADKQRDDFTVRIARGMTTDQADAAETWLETLPDKEVG